MPVQPTTDDKENVLIELLGGPLDGLIQVGSPEFIKDKTPMYLKSPPFDDKEAKEFYDSKRVSIYVFSHMMGPKCYYRFSDWEKK